MGLKGLLLCGLATGVLAWADEVRAEGDEDLRARMVRLEALVERQQTRLDEQEALIARQARALGESEALSTARLDDMRGLGVAAPTAVFLAVDAAASPQTVQPAVRAPVGEAPPEAPAVPVEALPEGIGVLTPRGRLVLEPSADFVQSASERLVFRGVEVVPGVQVGVIEAGDADRTAFTAALTARFGVTERLEVEARLPWMRREDRVTTVQQREEAISRSLTLRGSGVGDVEVAARYQLTRGLRGRPVVVANLRVKSDTGSSPYEVDRDAFGVATELATGSGFWAVEPGVSFLMPSDPVVLFGGLGWVAHLPRDVNRTVGEVTVGRVDPGDAFNAAFGFGFALNERFSYSLAYKHSYIRPTETELNGQPFSSNPVHVGALTFGMSYRLTPRLTVNTTVEAGLTEEAPDVRLQLRLPVRF